MTAARAHDETSASAEWLAVMRELFIFKRKVEPDLIEHLDRLPLVNSSNRKGVRRLEKAIHFADIIHSVGTKDMEPARRSLSLRSLAWHLAVKTLCSPSYAR